MTRFARSVISGTLAAVMVAGMTLSAQQAATGQKPFQPQSGQAGKDVVWVPTPQPTVDAMLALAKITKADFLIDLGSGDGITVISAAKRGTRALGIEFNPDMVALSVKNAQAAGVPDRATFRQGDLFETDFSQATVLTMFLLPSINMKLRPTILNMKPGTRVVSNSFTMEDWVADETKRAEDCPSSYCTAYLWIVPAKVNGAWTMGSATLTFDQKFQNVTGTLGSAAITDGKLNGSEITFTVGATKYTGTVSADGKTIAGSGWTATRAPASYQAHSPGTPG
jgi:precorrin-6B methylase 2